MNVKIANNLFMFTARDVIDIINYADCYKPEVVD